MNPIVSKPNATASPPHPSTFFPELRQCKTMRDMKQVHARLIKTGRIHDPLAAAELLRFCALSDPPRRDLHYACLVFHSMDQPNCFSWNTIIRALSESDDEDTLEALFVFQQMVCSEFVEPNRFTFPSVLKACARAGRLKEGKQIHGLIMKHGLDCDDYVASNLVRMYVMCDVMNDACVLFNSSVGMDNENKGNLEKRRQLGDVVLRNVMIDGYVRLRDVKAARHLFDKMPQRSVVSWNSMISGSATDSFPLAMRRARATAVTKTVMPSSTGAGDANGSAARSPGKEVRFHPIRKRPWGRFTVEIRDPWKKTRVWLGTFDSVEDTARAYDSGARTLCRASTAIVPLCPARFVPIEPSPFVFYGTEGRVRRRNKNDGDEPERVGTVARC
ncbi:hypothetical protein U1Q18_035376 [Sarracenia purpurea var. burkii]